MAVLRDVASGPADAAPWGKGNISSFGRLMLVLIVLSCALAFSPSRAAGTEEYATQTGKECDACHLDPSGGGELTAAGDAYRRELDASGQSVPETGRWRKPVRFLAGFLHMLTAVMWFGTILYVHLLLKPSYAAHGLPRGELLVGWGSIILIAVTGGVLTAFRIRAPEDFLHTRFGILLLMKIVLYLVMVTTAVIVTFIVGPRLRKRQGTVDRGKRDMTTDELSRYDGKEGRPAYFAFDGRIYDVTESKLWKEGSHLGRHRAGFDLTDILAQAPHGKENIEAMPHVGRLLAAENARGTPTHLKAFYFMTYFNLGLVLAILAVISLWRWW